jgi:hypothetical protein
VICAAEHMGELVMQTHRGAAKSPASEPGTAKGLNSSVQIGRPPNGTG